VDDDENDDNFVNIPPNILAPPKVSVKSVLFTPKASQFSVQSVPYAPKTSKAKASASNYNLHILQLSKEVDLIKKEIFLRQDSIKRSADLLKKNFNTKFDIVLNILAKFQEKLGVDAYFRWSS
ncbi:hypothetical protein PanWU01x14_129490, partial [Parasponia andersonii]